MRARALIIIAFLLLALPITGFAQSTLNFPKFFSTTELPNSGFAIVNPGSTTANVTFTLYAANGSVVSTSTATSYPALGPGTQQALLGNQIFSTLGTGGWVQATSTTSGLQGFWLTYNGSLTYLDGAAAATPAVNQTIPLVAGSTNINVANPNNSATTVSLELRGATGTLLATAVSETISAFGVFNSDAFTLFGVAAPTQTCYVRVLSGSTNALATTAFVTNYLVSAEAGVINGVDESSTALTLNLPQVASGPIAGGPLYETEVGVANLTGVAQTVTVTFFTCPTGSATSVPACTALPPVQVALAARGAMVTTAQSMFGLSSTAFTQGWIQMTGTAPIAGFAAYADTVDGALAVVPAVPSGSTNLMFAHIANLYPSDPWETGIALLNAGSTSASVQIYAMTPAGVLLGGASTDATAKLTIPPLTRSALGLSQMIPEAGPTATHTSDGGFIYVQSSVPIFGAELFYNSNVAILANVAAGTVATGITYTPPAPPAPLTLTSVTPAKIATGGTITLSGTGFGSTSGSNVMTFATASGTVTSTAPTQTPTTITLFLPPTAITGPVTVTTGGVTSNAVIVEVLASPMAIAQDTVTVTAGSTLSGADIYVDVPAAAAGNVLVASEIGVAAVGATSIPFNEISATVTQGTTMQVLIYGSGISAANGTSLAFSGTGITVSGVQYGSLSGGTYMVAQIAISSSATIGARNAILTNSNLDVSVLSGGLIILASQ